MLLCWSSWGLQAGRDGEREGEGGCPHADCDELCRDTSQLYPLEDSCTSSLGTLIDISPALLADMYA